MIPKKSLFSRSTPQCLRILYSLPTIEIDIQNQGLALRRKAPQRLIFHWEGSRQSLYKNRHWALKSPIE